MDKLLNYIRYWQASGESIKTSLRVKTRMEQLTQEGHFTGGGIPYGYRIEKRGRTNKRNVEVNDMVIDPEAAQIMQSRTQQHLDIPLNLKGSALLVGKVYCGHCGTRLTLTTSGKRKTCIDGSVQ